MESTLAWKTDIEAALTDFSSVAKLATREDFTVPIEVEFLPAPHRPSGLPAGKMAVYAFFGGGGWLKIGKVGPNSDARFRSQHYAPGRARSSLAGSLLMDDSFATENAIEANSCGDWIKSNTHRCNIYLPASSEKSLLSLLEAFLHHRLKPRYEG